MNKNKDIWKLKKSKYHDCEEKNIKIIKKNIRKI